MSAGAKGRLKIYLGYAAGVGKTYRMLQEAQALRQKGVDIVIGSFGRGYATPNHSAAGVWEFRSPFPKYRGREPRRVRCVP